MSTDPLGRTVHDNVRAVLDRTDQVAWHSFASALAAPWWERRWVYLPCRTYCQRSVGSCVRVRPVRRLIRRREITKIVLQTFAISLIGLTLYLGFPILSTNMALVFSSMAAENAAGSSDVTNLTAIPYLLRSTARGGEVRNQVLSQRGLSTFELVVCLVE